jgi:hypothetical protein
MVMKAGEQWHCTNAACHCEILVQSDSQLDGSNPRCVCGAPMKKKYAAPNFCYLDFLRLDERVPAPQGSRES